MTSPATDTITFSLLAEVRTFPDIPQTALPDRLNRPFVYVAAKTGGLIVFEETGEELREAYQIPLDSLHGLEVMNVDQQGNLLCLALGNFFGGAPQPPGMAIVDVTQPATPVVRDIWFDDRKQSGAAFVKAIDDHAYLAAMDAGLYIFDISDPDAIDFRSNLLPDIHFPTPNPNEIQRPNARGLDVDGHLLYLCYDAGGIRVIDISDRENPREINRYINQQALNKQQAYNNIVIRDKTAYVAIDFCGLEILDLTDPQAIRRTGWWNPWHCEGPANTWFNSPGHINQVALDAERPLVFLSAGDSELQVVDVSDPAAPALKGKFGQPMNDLGVWGASIRNDRVYLSYINTLGIPFRGTWSGVKVLQMDVVNSASVTSREGPFQLESSHPNPFSTSIRFSFVLFSPQKISLFVFNSVGQEVAQPLKQQFFSAGEHQVEWRPAANLPPGMYRTLWQIGEQKQLFNILKHQE